MIVKRSANERKKLPPELEAFARSQDEKLRVSRPRVDRGRVNDPREGYTIAGVANRDGRSVYDTRSEAMRALWADGKADEAALNELGQLLHDAQRLVLWRARRLTGFEAFAEEVVGIPAARAQELVEAHTGRTGEAPTELSERNVAAWLRTEAGAYEGDERARARISSTPHGLKLVLTVSLAGASAALAGVGNRHAPLAREQEGSPDAAPMRRAAPVVAEPSVAPESAPVRPPAEAVAAGARLLTRKRSREEMGAELDEQAELAAPVKREVDERPARQFDRSRAEPRAASLGSRERQPAPRDRSEKRPSFAEGQSAGKRTFGARPGVGHDFAARAGHGEKRGHGQKASFGDKRGFGDKPFASKAHGDKRERPAFGDKRERPAFGDKRAAGPKASFGEKRSFGAVAGEKRGFGAGGGDKRGGYKGAGGGFKGAGGGFKGAGGGFKGAGGGGFQRGASAGGAGGFKKPFGKGAAGGGKSFAGKGAGGGKKSGGFAERPAKAARHDDAGDE